ncbi:MAG: threonine ammonia-lyase, partial [Pseudomonadota bacterium]
IDTIREAAHALSGAVVRTPLLRSGPLSDLTGAEVYLKLETLQYTGSFKDRGALVKLLSLTPEQAKNGVIAVSAGNHAQGVAYHARRLGIPATIVMPRSTPFTKIGRTEALGGRVLLHGDSVSGCLPYAEDIMRKQHLTFVHPFDDPHIISGQGTVGLEIFEDLPDFDSILVPIGGGGLVSGIATAYASMAPDVEIVGVEADLYPSMRNALTGMENADAGPTLAEGIAIKKPGALTLPIVRRAVHDILTVGELSIEDAVQTMLVSARVIAEGAGAAPLAALTAAADRFAGKTVVLVVSGANIDSRILASVLMRGMVRSGQMVRVRVTISDTPGVLARVAQLIGEHGGNIVEIVHQRLFFDVPVKQAEVDIVIETQDADHVSDIIHHLDVNGFPTRRLGDTAQSG